MLNDIIKVLILTLVSLIVLFILAKLMGFKQMSQMSMFDYINGITIGSIAAELATSLEDDYKMPLIAMIIYGIVSYLLSKATQKSIIGRRVISGKPIVLINDGEIYKDNLNKARLDIDELLSELRNLGYFNPSDIYIAIMETNGKISVLPRSTIRPVTPEDLNLSPRQKKTPSNVILDGKIMDDNLKYTGNSREWLLKQIGRQGIKDVSKIFLATCDGNNNLSVFINIKGEGKKNVFS